MFTAIIFVFQVTFGPGGFFPSEETERIKLWMSADRKEVTCASGGECGLCGSMTDPGPNQFNSPGNGGEGPILLMPEGKHIKRTYLARGNLSVHGEKGSVPMWQ